MPKAYDIITQLRSVLPRYTNYFSDEFTINSLTRSGSTVTAVTATSHGLQNDYYVRVVNALTPFTLASLQITGQIREDGVDKNIVTGVTNEPHDLTERWPIDKPLIEITGANEGDYNGEHILKTVPNRKTFTYHITATPSSPATGTIKLLSDLSIGYNGWHQVTVVNDTTFTYPIDTTPESPALGTPVARTRARISGAVSVERVLEVYTDQPPNKVWGFVVLGNAVANKDRAIFSDATAEFGKGEDFRQKIIQPFGVYVFIPATNSIAARNERDIMEDLVVPFFRSLLRVKFPTDLTEDPYSGCVFSSHGFFDYVGSYYVHEFAFETTGWIVEGDTLEYEPNVAFRDIFVNYRSPIETSDNIIMTDHIDLDDEPLE